MIIMKWKKGKSLLWEEGEKRSSLFLTELIILSEGVRGSLQQQQQREEKSGEDVELEYPERLDICDEINSGDPILNYSTRTKISPRFPG